MWTECLQHSVVKQSEIVDSTAKVEEKPDDDNWCEGAGEFRCSERLREEEKDENGAADSNNGCLLC